MAIDYLFYWLLLSMPVRFVLYTVHVYLQNLIALLQLTNDALSLIMELLVLSRRSIRRLRRYIGPVPLINRLLHIVYYELTTLGFFIKLFSLLLRIPVKVLTRLSRLFRICAHGRTWVLMMRLR
ncbi:uncharacterized protein LOC115621621 [Scaptodrosophila lebanonensis]|uniref:Uncharacterized protein LOC115621621 n=1 Tax=Drosophila lebanonensis TaxID=7225 RepID=A0A6J2T2M8_DROLE|nr:uncharacterized protein LOC115621621 [Scaptodrosophila lebanonensis]